AVEQDVAGAGVAVAGLADGADVEEGLLIAELVGVVDVLGAEELHGLGEDAGDVGVAVEAVAVDEGEEALHLGLLVDVLGEDVLVGGVAGGAVDEEEAALLLVGAGAFAEELPALLHGLAVGDGELELLAGPVDGAFGG